jgi:hypothetical protein
MSKALYLFVSFFFPLLVWGQSPSSVTKGKIVLLGNTSLNSTSKNPPQAISTTIASEQMLQWQVSLGVGYVVSNRWTVGLLGGYESQKNTTELETIIKPFGQDTYSFSQSQTNNHQKAITMGVFAQWQQPITEKLTFFVQPSIQFLTKKYMYENTTMNGRFTSNDKTNLVIDGTSKYNQNQARSGYVVAVRPGLLYFFTAKLAVTLTAGQVAYASEKTSSLSPDSRQREFDFNPIPDALSDVRLGIQLYL